MKVQWKSGKPDRNGYYIVLIDPEYIGVRDPYPEIIKIDSGLWELERTNYNPVLAWDYIPELFGKETSTADWIDGTPTIRSGYCLVTVKGKIDKTPHVELWSYTYGFGGFTPGYKILAWADYFSEKFDMNTLQGGGNNANE